MRPGKHLAAFFFILLSFSAAYACSCAQPRSPCNYYATDAVFLGQVVGSSELTVGEGEKLKGYDMTLPVKLATREVMVTVVWPNGSPAVNVDVRYEISEGTSPGDSVTTDKQGRVVLTLFENYRYIVLGSADRNNKDFHSAPIEILVNKDLKPFKLVLDKRGYGEDAKDALKRKPPQ
jgi:hypothetical protein